MSKQSISWDMQENYGDPTFKEHKLVFDMTNKKPFMYFSGQEGIRLGFREAEQLLKALKFFIEDKVKGE